MRKRDKGINEDTKEEVGGVLARLGGGAAGFAFDWLQFLPNLDAAPATRPKGEGDEGAEDMESSKLPHAVLSSPNSSSSVSTINFLHPPPSVIPATNLESRCHDQLPHDWRLRDSNGWLQSPEQCLATRLAQVHLASLRHYLTQPTSLS